MFPGSEETAKLGFNPRKTAALEALSSCNAKRLKFSVRDANADLNSSTKLSALKNSASIVSLVSYSGENELFQCSGTVIESDSTYAIILTSAHLLRCPSQGYLIAPDVKVSVHLSDNESFNGVILACDFHLHLAAIKIHTTTQVPPASITLLNDSLAIDPTQSCTLHKRKPFELRPHANSLNLVPGDPVNCVGRYFREKYEVMAAPGVLSSEFGDFDCKELFMTTCCITRCGTGGPLINCCGDVIGLCFYDVGCTPFLPINIVLTWWDQFKKHGELRRPSLGMELANLCEASLGFLEKITRKFPDILEGVFVNEVTHGSSADVAGFQFPDVIIEFGGKPVRSFLELIEESWKRVGEVVEIVVIRESNDHPLRLSMAVDDVSPDNYYKWDGWEDVL